MNKQHTICVLGGSGFIGCHLAARLVQGGHQVRIPTRYRAGQRELFILPTVDVMEADVHDPDNLRRVMDGCDTVINLAGILNEPGRDDGSGFERVHTRLPELMAHTARELGVHRVLQVSAIGADSESAPSYYLRSKGGGEQAIQRELDDTLPWTVLRPSVIFGPGDSFVNRFAGLLRFAPVAMPLPTPEARFAPVYVGDVVSALIRCIEDKDTFGKTFELCGPKSYTLKQIVQLIARVTGRRTLIIGLPDGVSRMQARVMQRLPGKPFSMDNYRSTQVDNVCGNHLPGLTALDIEPSAMEAVIPTYLTGAGRARGRYTEFRREFRRVDRDDQS